MAMASLILPFMFERLRIENGSLGLLMVAVCLLGSVSALFGNMMQGFKMYSLSVWTFALSAPFRLLIMLVLMPFRPLSGYVAGQTAGPVVNILGAWTVFRRHLGRAVKFESYWKEHGSAIIRYTLPFIAWTVTTTISSSLETLVIRHRLSDFESAGYYIITRFSDISAYLGMAFSAFVFPMVASKKSKDRESRNILIHSIAGTFIAGLVFSGVLAVIGKDVLGATKLWQPYSDLSELMAFWSVNATLSAVATCLITYETAQGRFRFLWYAIPIVVAKALFLYAVTGYTFFEGILPNALLSAIEGLNPCRLSFVTGAFLVVQLLLTGVLLFDVFNRAPYGNLIKRANARVAVVAHVFYENLWNDIAVCIRNVVETSGDTDIFVTVPENADGCVEARVRADFPSADVKRLPNRGFDVGPFFEVLHRIDLEKYDYVIKLHTKRDCFGIVNFWPFWGGQWRRALLGFCSTKKRMSSTFDVFAASHDVGMVGAGMLALKPGDELVGRYSVKDQLEVPSAESDSKCFIAGTMFAVRARLLAGLKQKYSFCDFELMQLGAHDTSEAHGIEREFGHDIYNQGCRIGFCPKSPVIFANTIGARRALYGFLCTFLRWCKKK